MFSNASRESVYLKYDNILIYNINLHVGATSKPLIYTLKNDTLIVEKKVLPIGTEHFTRSRESVYGQSFKCYKDSLINIDTGEAFYSPSYIKKRNHEAGRNNILYIVHKGVKHRITKKNYNRSLLVKLQMDDYNIKVVDKETAYKIYNIPKRYTTFQLIKK